MEERKFVRFFKNNKVSTLAQACHNLDANRISASLSTNKTCLIITLALESANKEKEESGAK